MPLIEKNTVRNTTLPKSFCIAHLPEPVLAPQLLQFNDRLSQDLCLDWHLRDKTWIAGLLSGNTVHEGCTPVATAYSGHQFGQFVPILGDGRAILIGEVQGATGAWWDIQLKGSGQTPFSRRGDGRAPLGAMLREYLVSEAMHALGIRTSRSLAVVATGEHVYREEALPGAVLTRVARSHLRIGTFEYAARFTGVEGLRQLADYAIARHYPHIVGGNNLYHDFLTEVVRSQAQLVAQWMSIGFIHGVMNTDNIAISGDTIDYGPCAFLDDYNPDTVFSSIDHQCRYAYSNQARVSAWNLARFAETLLPLIHPNKGQAIALAEEAIGLFDAYYHTQWLTQMCLKLGIQTPREEDGSLIQELLSVIHLYHMDYTLTYRQLGQCTEGIHEGCDIFKDKAQGLAWHQRWLHRLKQDPPCSNRSQSMALSNPIFIPRNHLIEKAIHAAVHDGDLALFSKLVSVLKNPYTNQEGCSTYSQAPLPSERVTHTFCGT